MADIENKSNNQLVNKKHFFGVILGAVILAAIVLWVAFYFFHMPDSPGTFGDTLGGSTAPVFNLATALLLYFSFVQQAKINEKQSQRIEALTKEQIDQSERQSKQIVALTQKQIEQVEDDVLRQVKIRNFDVFMQIFNQLKEDYSNLKFSHKIRLMSNDYQENFGYNAIKAVLNFYHNSISSMGDEFIDKEFVIRSFFEILGSFTFLIKKLGGDIINMPDDPSKTFFDEDKKVLMHFTVSFYENNLKIFVEILREHLKNANPENSEKISNILSVILGSYERLNKDTLGIRL
jgi:hypothetical protein